MQIPAMSLTACSSSALAAVSGQAAFRSRCSLPRKAVAARPVGKGCVGVSYKAGRRTVTSAVLDTSMGTSSSFTPMAAKKDEPPVIPPIVFGERGPTDLWDLLLQSRIIYVREQINDKVATRIVQQLLTLEMMDPTKDIKMYINCLGGSLYSVLGIFDVIQTISCDVQTVAFGQCVSNAALLLAIGTKGKRFSMPNTRIMIHQPMTGISGELDDVIIQAKEAEHSKAMVDEIYMEITGRSITEIKHYTDRDYFMGPEVALEFGIIDGIQ
eukprot:jgi/Mesvir1/10679/Mv13770-RA.1